MKRSHETKPTLRHNSITHNRAKLLTVRQIRRILERMFPARRRILVAARPVRPDLLYPKGIMGGYLITIVLRDGRPGREDQLITLEMKWVREFGWYPLKRELTTAEAAAVCGVALTTFYRLSADLASKKKVFGQSFFDTRKLFAEMALVDELAVRVEARRGGRPGAHAAHCPDPVHGPGPCPHAAFCRADPSHKAGCEDAHTSYCRNHDHDGCCDHAPFCKASVNHAGSCKDANDPRRTNRATPASPGWSKKQPLGRNNAYERCAPDTGATVPPSAESEPRQTVTEAAINAATSDSDTRAAMYAEERDQIAAERAAGRFVAKDDEVK